MGFPDGEVAWQFNAHLNGDVIAYAAGKDLVNIHNAVFGRGDVGDLFFNCIGKTGLCQFGYCSHKEVQGHFQNEDADNDGGDGIEYTPTLSKKNGSGDADGGADGREGV